MAFYHETVMPTVDDKNFNVAVPPEDRDEFWRRVKFSLRHFFNADEDLAEQCRRSIETSPIGEQLLVYHDAPLHIAADLADEIALQKHYDAYRQQFPDEFDSQLPLMKP